VKVTYELRKINGKLLPQNELNKQNTLNLSGQPQSIYAAIKIENSFCTEQVVIL